MRLLNSRYSDLVKDVKQKNKKIVVYGAGMIGQVVVPYIIEKYELQEYVTCFVDMDKSKKGQKIKVGEFEYEIFRPDILRDEMKNLVILITNSKFYEVVEFLDSIEEIKNAEGYVIPMMQIYELQFVSASSIKRLSEVPLIPKKIHYCWFGGKELPKFLLECIESWKHLCPDYQIIEWNESNYDITKIPYVKEAYENRKYGFVTDVARLDILYEYGGIYMDTDVLLYKNLDELLYQPAFVGVEKWGNINTGGGVGAVAGHPMIKELLDYRKMFHFILEDGRLNIETNGLYETIPFVRHGMKVDNSMQIINGMTVYPWYIFHPYDYMSCEKRTEESTISMHCFYGGWMEEKELKSRSITQEKYNRIWRRMNS